MKLLFHWIFTLSQVSLLFNSRKGYIVETNLALLYYIFLHFPAMSFKCGIVLLILVGGNGYCKYQNKRWRARQPRMYSAVDIHVYCTYRHAHISTRTPHIHARPQPRILTREFTNARTHMNSHLQAHKHKK